MKEVFLVLSDSKVGLLSPDEALDGMQVPIDGEGSAADVAGQIEDRLGFNFKGKKLVLAANCKKTLIRVADANEFGHKRGFFKKKIADGVAWEVIKSVFPFGPSINEDTHLFDISVYSDKKFVCFGLPVDICEKLAEIGKELTGSLHKVSRLETIENLMFANHCGEDKIIIFPQDDGFRLLAIKDSLPENAFYISNHADRREAELERVLVCLGEKRTVCTSSFMLPSDDLGWISKYK